MWFTSKGAITISKLIWRKFWCRGTPWLLTCRIFGNTLVMSFVFIFEWKMTPFSRAWSTNDVIRALKQFHYTVLLCKSIYEMRSYASLNQIKTISNAYIWYAKRTRRKNQWQWIQNDRNHSFLSESPNHKTFCILGCCYMTTWHLLNS